MPSPLSHVAMGYAIYKLRRANTPDGTLAQPCCRPRLLLFTVALSLAPDLDVLPGLLARDLGRFHNTISNSVWVGLLIALGVASFAWARYRAGFLFWFSTAALCYGLHIMMDLLTVSRGLMLMWPLTAERYDIPVKLFYGVHWSDGWVSVHHIVTIATELLLIGFILLVLRIYARSRKVRLLARD